MDTESINGKMEPCMRENGKIIKLMGRERFGIVEVTFTQENFLVTRHMGLEFIFIRMEAGMKVTGYMMCNKGKEKSSGLMEHLMSETIKMA